MKVRIKNTGEIVNTADYATIDLEQCDSYGNPLRLSLDDVEFINEQTEDAHWQNVRELAALAALRGVSSRRYLSSNDCTGFAIDCADKLVEELKKK